LPLLPPRFGGGAAGQALAAPQHARLVADAAAALVKAVGAGIFA